MKTRHNPWNELDRAWHRFDHFFSTPIVRVAETQRINVRCGDGGDVTVTADLPGVELKDVCVEINDNVLTIAAELPAPEHRARSHRSERAYGEFNRDVRLPLRAEKTEATLKDGVLTVIVTAAEHVPRQIEVSAT